MKTISRILLPIALASSAASASAADYDLPVVYEPPVVVQEIEEYVPVEVGSGWYLRGDIGYSFSTSPRGDFTYRVLTALGYTEAPYNSGSLAPDISFGVGFGYHFNDLLRADITAEKLGARFDGTRNQCMVNGVLLGGCTDTGEMDAWSVMLNGYVDLGTFAKFTPYVGAGLGMTRTAWGPVTTTFAPGGGGVPFEQPGTADWRFTYAAMAGVAYDINESLKVDLGYKYRNVAGGSMFGFDALSATAGASGTQGRDAGFSQHEIRLGLRYELW